METKENYSDNCKYILNIYENLHRMIENSAFNLLEEDANLKKTVEKDFKAIKKRLNSKWTTCAIFDAFDTPMIIDGLVKERLSKTLDEFPYLIEGDSARRSIMTDLKDMKIKMKYIKQNSWKILENSSIILSDTEYIKFLRKLKMCGDIPDLVVLVLSSPTKLNDENIKSFLKELKEDYIFGNFILVLNNARSVDCVCINICDVCYPEEIRSFLGSTGLSLEDRVFKVSTPDSEDVRIIDIIQNNIHSKFTELRQIINSELDINTVMEKHCKKATEMCQAMLDLKNNFDKQKIISSINQYDSSLQQKSEEIITKINNRELESNEIIYDLMRKNIKKKDNKNKELMEMYKKLYRDLKQKLGKELENLNANTDCRDYNEKVGKLARDMFLKASETSEDVEKAIEPFLEDIKWEFLEEEINENDQQPEGQTFFQGFIECIKKATSKLFTMAKDSFKKFVKTFQAEAVKTVDELKKHFDERLLWSPEIDRHLSQLKSIVSDKTKLIKDLIDEDITQIVSQANARDRSNIHSYHFGDFISFSGANDRPHYIERWDWPWKYNCKISSETANIEEEIKAHLRKTPVKEFHNDSAANYILNILDLSNIIKVALLSDYLICEFLYKMRQEIYHRNAVQGEIETVNIFRLIRKSLDKWIPRTFIRKPEILEEVQTLQQKLHENVDELKMELIGKIDDYLRERI